MWVETEQDESFATALGRGSERVHRNQLLLFQSALEPDILSNSYAKDPPGLLWF